MRHASSPFDIFLFFSWSIGGPKHKLLKKKIDTISFFLKSNEIRNSAIFIHNHSFPYRVFFLCHHQSTSEKCVRKCTQWLLLVLVYLNLILPLFHRVCHFVSYNHAHSLPSSTKQCWCIGTQNSNVHHCIHALGNRQTDR